MTSEPLLQFNGVHKTFGTARRSVHAVRGIDLTLVRGGSVGLVGESGCGKSTTARLAIGLEKPTEGTVEFKGSPLDVGDRRAIRDRGEKLQFIFQDPYSSLNPRMRISSIVAEPLVIQRVGRKEIEHRVMECLENVGLDGSVLSRYPHQFSGGQRQRIAIARALTVRPELLVLDEPTSGLDVSIQSQILDLLRGIRKLEHVGLLFISHDLAVVRELCDEVAIMYLGEIVEKGPAKEIFDRPRHPYSQALLAASLEPDPEYERDRHRVLAGSELPSQYAPPSGCSFHPRCHVARSVGEGEIPNVCRSVHPELEESDGSRVACHFSDATLKFKPGLVGQTT